MSSHPSPASRPPAAPHWLWVKTPTPEQDIRALCDLVLPGFAGCLTTSPAIVDNQTQGAGSRLCPLCILRPLPEVLPAHPPASSQLCRQIASMTTLSLNFSPVSRALIFAWLLPSQLQTPRSWACTVAPDLYLCTAPQVPGWGVRRPRGPGSGGSAASSHSGRAPVPVPRGQGAHGPGWGWQPRTF